MTTNVKTALRRKTDEDRLGRLQVAQPDKLVARFVRLLAHRLKSTTGLPVDCRCQGYTVCRMSTLTDEAPTDGSLAVGELGAFLRAGGQGFAGAMIVTPDLAARIIEASLDLPAPEDADAESARPVTRVDEALVLPFIEDAFAAFAMALREVETDTRGEPGGAAYGHPSWVQGGEAGMFASGLKFSRYVKSTSSLVDVEASEEMMSMSLEIAFLAGAAPVTVPIYLSLAAIERLRGSAAPSLPAPQTEPPSDPVWAAAMRRAATHADLKLTAVLRRMQLSAGDVGDLRVGDVLPLSLDGGMDVTLALSSPDGVAEEGVLCAGYLGAAGDSRAVMITEPPHHSVVAEAEAMTAT